MHRTTRCTVACLLAMTAAVAHGPATGQTALDPPPGAAPAPLAAPTPGALVAMVHERLAHGTADAFDSIHPHDDVRRLVRAAREQGITLRAGPGRVLVEDGDRAVVLITAHPEFANSGDETILSRSLSDAFEANRGADGWRMGARLPMDEGNRILSHALDVTIEPGVGLVVRDTMDVTVVGAYGFRARLNHAARVDRVTVDGRPARYLFGGGLLWVDIPSDDAVAQPEGTVEARVVLEYAIDVARDSAMHPNSGRFEPDHGHVRNQYFWHPFFDFHTSGDRSRFRITARAPAAYRVVTSIPQTDTVMDGMRVVQGQTTNPTFALTLMYDRDWEVVSMDLGGLRTEVFATPDFQPSADAISAGMARAHRVLSRRFGEPSSGYVAAVQGRSRDGSGWHFRSNDLIVGGARRGTLSRDGALARAWLAHEVAHGWTSPTGPAANLLSEGWAMYAESLILAEEYAPDAAVALWEGFRNVYMSRGFDGTASVMDDPNNAGVSYYKGAWILRMLEDRIGAHSFDAGFRSYMSIPPGQPAGIDEFVDAMSRAAGTPVGPFLRPWLVETVIPDVRARIEDGRVVLIQHGPLFDLDLEVDLRTSDGSVRRRVHVTAPETPLDTRDLGSVTEVHVDPGRRLLIRRHRGDIVRFELPADAAPDSAAGAAPDSSAVVRLHGDFLTAPLAAELLDGVWVVEIPLSEGQYAYWWSVDGAHRAAEGYRIRRVPGRVELPESYPH